MNKNWTQLIKRYYSSLLLVILCFAFLTRIYKVEQPSSYVFDEVYHAVTAKLVSHNDPRAYEWWNPPPEKNTAVDWLHPPLAKYAQALSMILLGENSFGWRFSSVFFGVLVVALIAKLADQLFDNKTISLLAAMLASLDGLLLVQSRVAMNDIHVTFFILLTLLVYARYRGWSIRPKSYSIFSTTVARPDLLVVTGLCAGLALGTKWSGLFVLALIGGFELIRILITIVQTSGSFRVLSKAQKKSRSALEIAKATIRIGLLLGVLPTVMYIASYSHMFLQGKSLWCPLRPLSSYWSNQSLTPWLIQLEKACDDSLLSWGSDVIYEGYLPHFVLLHKQIWWYQTNLTAEHGYQSRPWQWFLNIRPVWYYVEYGQDERADIYALGNPALFWIGDLAILGALGWSIVTLGKKMRSRKYKLPSWFNPAVYLLAAYAIVWLPWQASPRIMFFYHYTPAVPLLAIILAWGMYTLWQKASSSPLHTLVRAMLALAMISIFATFIVWYPHWTGITVPLNLKNQLYFALEGWK